MDAQSSRQQPYTQRPPYPQTSAQSSSKASSAFQSSSSLSSISSANAQYPPSHLTMPPQGYTSAPLPSPSSTQPRSYFGSIGGATQTSHPSQQGRLPTQSQGLAGQRGNVAGAPETAPFLKDFNLLAEAAKRAQMACLMRDMGDVEL